MRFNLQMFSTAMKLLPLLCLCLLTRSGTTFADEDGPVIIFMKEGSDVMLPCSLSSKESIEYKRFEWKKGDQQVFVYDAGTHSKNGLSGQDQQFKDRVSHFEEELKYGNASIIITNTKVADSGDYTCDFPNQQPRQPFHVQLVVFGPDAIKVEEDSYVILPCSLSSKENIMSKVFDWKKDGQKEVFFYDDGEVYGPNKTGQDQQFKGRVSHFSDELKYGNASIIIRKTKVTDSGDYTCIFPHLQTFHIQLIVGAASKPSVKILDETKDWALLQCVVRGASPKPTVKWQDSAGKNLTTKDSHDSERGGSFIIVLQTTVTKTDNYSCVATQEEIKHQIHTDINVKVNGFPTAWVVAVVFGVINTFLVGGLAVFLFGRNRRNYQRGRPKDPSTESPKESTTESTTVPVIHIVVKPPKESFTGLDVAVHVLVLAVGVLPLIPLWYSLRGSHTGLVVAVVFGVINTFLVGGLAVYVFCRNRHNSQTGFHTGFVVAALLAVAVLALILLSGYLTGSPTELALAVLCTVFVVVLAVHLVLKRAQYLRESPKESSTGLDVAAVVLSFAVVVLSFAILALILLWGHQTESSTAWVCAFLCAVLDVVLAVCFVRECAQLLRGQRVRQCERAFH